MHSEVLRSAAAGRQDLEIHRRVIQASEARRRPRWVSELQQRQLPRWVSAGHPLSEERRRTLALEWGVRPHQDAPRCLGSEEHLKITTTCFLDPLRRLLECPQRPKGQRSEHRRCRRPGVSGPPLLEVHRRADLEWETRRRRPVLQCLHSEP